MTSYSSVRSFTRRFVSTAARHAAFTAFAVVALAPIAADAAFVKAGDAAVTFTATGPGGLKIEGKDADLEVTEADGKVKFTAPLANLDTGISLRNRHMKEKYLEVGKYPAAVLVVDRAALKVPAAGAESSAAVPGTLTLHGQTHPVTVQYTAKNNGGLFAVSGTVRVNIKEYGIDVPSYLGVTVKPDVDIAVRYTAKDQ